MTGTLHLPALNTCAAICPTKYSVNTGGMARAKPRSDMCVGSTPIASAHMSCVTSGVRVLYTPNEFAQHPQHTRLRPNTSRLGILLCLPKQERLDNHRPSTSFTSGKLASKHRGRYAFRPKS